MRPKLYVSYNYVKPNDSMVHDDISMWVLSRIAPKVVKPLVHIFKISFSTGISPSEMKIAKYIPLFKNGNNSDFSNNGNISILSQLSKISEKLFDERLQQFLNINNILPKSEYGFRAHMSTVHAALELTESISYYNDSTQHCAEVFIDLKTAFDTVNRKLLVEKLSFYGVRGMANTWLENYLMNRKQYVVVDNQASSMQFIKCGVPQGSVLGPVLFLLFVNDIFLCNVSNLLKFVLFPDDTNIVCSNENIEVLQDTLNRELAKLFVWFSIYKLSLHLGKNKLYVVSKQTTRP